MALFLLLLRQIRQFSLKPESDASDLPQWMCDTKLLSSIQWTFNSVRLHLRPYYRQGSLTHDALTAAEGFKSDVESKWRMDPTIVALVVTQLLVATAMRMAANRQAVGCARVRAMLRACACCARGRPAGAGLGGG